MHYAPALTSSAVSGLPILPLKTHPDVGYRIEALPDAEAIVQGFKVAAQGNRSSGWSNTVNFSGLYLSHHSFGGSKG